MIPIPPVKSLFTVRGRVGDSVDIKQAMHFRSRSDPGPHVEDRPRLRQRLRFSVAGEVVGTTGIYARGHGRTMQIPDRLFRIPIIVYSHQKYMNLLLDSLGQALNQPIPPGG